MGFGGLSNYIACNIFAAEIRLWSLEFAIYSKSRMRHDQSLNLGSQLKYINFTAFFSRKFTEGTKSDTYLEHSRTSAITFFATIIYG